MELAEVIGCLSDSRHRGVAVVGTAGLGKTRLVAEALRRGGFGAPAARVTVRQIRATAVAGKIPFGALAPLLPAELPPGTNRGNTLRLLADQILASAHGTDRLVLWLDDGHLLDDASWALFQQLVWRPNVRLVATARIGEAVLHRPDERLPEPLAVLCRDAIRRLDLAPLPAPELDQIIAAMLGGHVDSRTLGRLRRDCAGNLVMLRELIAASTQDGRLRQTDGVWRLHGEYTFTPHLVELIADRLAGLSRPARRAVELLAYGQPLGLDLLGGLAGRDAVEELAGANLVEVRDDRDRLNVWLTHPLYAEVLRLELPAYVAAERQRQLADAVEAGGTRGRQDQLRAASWRLAARDRIEPDVALAAARNAWAAGDLGLAERLGRAALSAGPSVPALRMMMEFLLFANRPADAEQLYQETDVHPGTEAERVSLAIVRAYNLFWGLDETPEALAVLAETLDTVGAGPGHTELRFWQAVVRMFNGDLAYVDRLERELGTTARSGTGWLLRGLTDLATGDFTAANSALDEVCAVPDHPWLTDAASLGTVWVHLLRGDLATAERLAVIGTASLPDRWEWDLMGSAWTMARGQVARQRGRIDEARRWQREGEGLLPPEKSIGFGFVTMAELAHAAALAGDAAAAHRALARAEAMRLKSQRWMALWIDLAEPWVVRVAGGPQTPLDIALATAERATDLGATAFVPVALHDAARLGGATQVADRLAELAAGTQLTGHRMLGCYAAHAAALARKDGEALDDVSVDFAAAGAMLLAAEAGAAAASANRAAGRGTSARLADARAARLLSACPGAILTGVGPAAQLTEREATIARLAATGLSSRDIADRLVLSTRTIDNHLGRVYTKLGIAGRSELSTVFTGA